MPELKERAVAVLKEFKGEAYAFGGGVLDTAPGKFAAEFGKKALFVGPVSSEWFRPIRDRVLRSLEKAGVEVLETVQSAAPNAPFEDVYRILGRVMALKPDVLVVADGGSGIDAVKAAAVLATLGGGKPDIDPFFGVGQVTEACKKTGLKPMPVVAVMMAASSGRAPDQVLQHHRPGQGAEEADRGRGHRPAARRLRLRRDHRPSP